MNACGLLGLLVALPLLWANAPGRGIPVVQRPAAAAVVVAGYRTVLVAGDGRLPVFDNAVEGVAERLLERGGSPATEIRRLSAAPDVYTQGAVRRATLRNVLRAVASMKPEAGEGCFLFATSHGAEDRGLWLQSTDEYVTPQALDRALAKGCDTAPTVVVISGCYSGIFAEPPMARANRVVLTAASDDRTSFGCGAGRTYTAYDKCLLDALDAGGTWPRAYASIRRCVAGEERRNDVTASEPQAWFGAAVANLALPVRAADTQP